MSVLRLLLQRLDADVAVFHLPAVAFEADGAGGGDLEQREVDFPPGRIVVVDGDFDGCAERSRASTPALHPVDLLRVIAGKRRVAFLGYARRRRAGDGGRADEG